MIGAPVFFQSVTSALPLAWSSYSPVYHAVSLLVLGPFGWLQSAAFWIFGLSLIALTAILHFHARPRFKPGLFALALLGLAFVVVGAHPTAIPGARETVTTLVHKGAATFIVLAFPFVCFLLVPSLAAKRYTAIRWLTIGVGVFALIFLTVGGAILVNRFSLVGLYERVLLGSGQLWIELVCAQLIVDQMGEKALTAAPPA